MGHVFAQKLSLTEMLCDIQHLTKHFFACKIIIVHSPHSLAEYLDFKLICDVF
jgi:hypothetical protein